MQMFTCLYFMIIFKVLQGRDIQPIVNRIPWSTYSDDSK